MHDLVIAGGRVVDGTGSPARQADVATIKSGEVTFAEEAETGARPGVLLRGAR
jgi:N-acyl-D-aspartate/D-glutamate deacylase